MGNQLLSVSQDWLFSEQGTKKSPKNVAEWRFVVPLLSFKLISAPFCTKSSMIFSSPI